MTGVQTCALPIYGLNSKIVLFDPFTQNIQIKKLWVKNNNRRIRCAYIIEEIIEETYNNWNGYKAIINDIKSKSLFGKIKFSDSSLELANELYSKIEITDWFECKNDNQLNSLKNVALDFHDSYIKKTKDLNNRSEERRVGKECRSRWSPYH